MNEPTFVGRLGAATAVRAERRRGAGHSVLIVSGEVEERQLDPETGRYRRCDIRLNGPNGRKLASGEMKRPEVPEGRDPRNEILREDARKKAVARGLPYYFTCNMADIVLWSVAGRPGEQDREEGHYQLAAISHSREVVANFDLIQTAWIRFLDDLELRLQAVESSRPSVTTVDVAVLRDAIDAIAEEAIDRTARRVAADSTLLEQIRQESFAAFGFSVALSPRHPADYRRELTQIIRLGAFVVAQKLVLYRVLSEVGPRRADPFRLDELTRVDGMSDPPAVRGTLHMAIAHAIRRSGDYETAFTPRSLEDAVFLEPETAEEVGHCRVGRVWQNLIDTIASVSWSAISRNLVGFLYEAIVAPEFRHDLGQHYTHEDVVDLLVTFAIRQVGDVVVDPAAGGGSFLRSGYARKRVLGCTHDQALAEVWGFEIASFAAELATVSLATADTHEAAAYPRVLLSDFFHTSPGLMTPLQIPGEKGPLHIPVKFDAVIGNPPYISYRHQTNQSVVLDALRKMPPEIGMPIFSGKSDEYVWFMVHATRFLKEGGRLAFVVSSAILFSDYGIPLIRFLGKHYRILAVIDSMVERWFVEADTNTVLLWLERECDEWARVENQVRFVRLRRPLSRLMLHPDDLGRRDSVEDLVEEILTARAGVDDPRFLVNVVPQGRDGALEFSRRGDESVASEAELESQ